VLNRLGEHLLVDNRPPVPVTVPELAFLKKGPPVDDEPERRETAARFLEARTIRTVECWQAIGRAESFEAWVKIGKALQIGRDYSLKTTGANRPEGRRYCAAFSLWVEAHGFSGMQKSLRSVCIDLAENSDAITAWRNGLPERQRRRLNSPLAVTRRWKAATGQSQALRSQDLRRDAKAAWVRFCACVKALPADEAQPLWRLIAAEATVHIS
jgi:hypothetical protein